MLNVSILGAGTPTPTARRFGSSQVVQVGADLLMFDCGPAAVQKLAQVGIKPTDVSHLFLTHHHFDHTADYPCLLLSRWDQAADQGRTLKVVGPSPTVATTETLIGPGGVYWPDIQARMNHPASHAVFRKRGGVLPRKPPRVDARDISAGAEFSGDGWQVRTSHAVHMQPWLESIAYRVDTDEGSVVVTGDTAPCEAVTELARKADLMVCMCWDNQESMDPAETDAMCGSTAAADMAAAAAVKHLVLVHCGPGVDAAGHEHLISGVRERFGGNVIVATEGLQLSLASGARLLRR